VKSKPFLLITNQMNHRLITLLELTLRPSGELTVIDASETAPRLLDGKYSLIIVDSAAVSEPELLVSQLRDRMPDCRVVVITPEPSWETARAAFEAGAMDFLPNTLGVQELQDSFDEILRKPVPPWPRWPKKRVL